MTVVHIHRHGACSCRCPWACQCSCPFPTVRGHVNVQCHVKSKIENNPQDPTFINLSDHAVELDSNCMVIESNMPDPVLTNLPDPVLKNLKSNFLGFSP